MIIFKEITTQNFEAVCLLTLGEGQHSFVASNVVSLAEAYAYRNEGLNALPFAIYDDETLIGFVMLGYGSEDSDCPKIAHNNYILWRLMIDMKHQGKGYFKLILNEIIRYVKTSPCGKAEYIWLSYEPKNEWAKKLYQKYGFVENGEYCDNEVVAVLKL